MAKRKAKLPLWPTISTHVELYHGCTQLNALRIRAAVNPHAGRAATDFGTGFYTTTRLDQATDWARRQFLLTYPTGIDPRGLDAPAVVMLRVPLDALAALQTLAFVRGESAHPAFWSFVNHCRASNSHEHPSRPKPGDWYDGVSGPVAKLPLARCEVLGTYNGHEWSGMDQFSFHTPAAAAMLNAINRNSVTEFDIIRVKP